MKSRFIKLLVIFIASFLVDLNAQVGLDKLAQSTMNFLSVSVSPKASSMGDAVFAYNKGAESIFYNPAGIVNSDSDLDLVFNYTKWIADINYLGGAVTYNLNSLGSVGFHLFTVDYGTINGTSLILESQQALYPAGYIDNGPVGNVGAYSVGFSYGKAINEQFSIGGNIKYVGQNLGTNNYYTGRSKDNDASKLVFDAGVIYNTGYKGFKFGMAIRNFSSNIKREEIDEQLPTTFTIGTALELFDIFYPEHDNSTSLTFTSDYLHSNNYSERVNFGMEYKLLNRIYLRGGYQTNRDLASWTGGLGLVQSISDYTFELNFSYSEMEVFDNVTRLALGFSF